jgi:hypothetical protein
MADNPTQQHIRPRRRRPGDLGGAGIGIDAFGGSVVDPTENVRELVLAESKYQDGMRDSVMAACEALHAALRDSIVTRINDLEHHLQFVVHTYDQRLETEDKNRADALKQAALNIQTGLDKTERLLAENMIAVELRMSEKLELRFSNSEKLYEEKFRSIDTQFRERDTRTEQTGKDNKIALDAALQAAEKAVGAKNQSNDLAIAKSEMSMTKQIEQLQVTISTKDQASTDKISDLKDRLIANDAEQKSRLSTMENRLAAIEGRGAGAEENKKWTHDNSTLYVALAALLVAIIVGAVGITRSTGSATPTTFQQAPSYGTQNVNPPPRGG